MPHPLIEALVGMMARGTSVPNTNRFRCDFEDCPGRTRRAAKQLIYHQRYLFVHRQCVPGARAAAHKRGEIFAFRSGI